MRYYNSYIPKERFKIDLSLAENPLGPSPKVLHTIKSLSASEISCYPSVDDEHKLIDAISQHFKIDQEQILLGAGAMQLLEDVIRIINPFTTMVFPSASFPEPIEYAKSCGRLTVGVPLLPGFRIDINAIQNYPWHWPNLSL